MYQHGISNNVHVAVLVKWYTADGNLIEFGQQPEFEVCTLGSFILEIEDKVMTQLCVQYPDPGYQLDDYRFEEELELSKFSRIVPDLRRLRLEGLHRFVNGLGHW